MESNAQTASASIDTIEQKIIAMDIWHLALPVNSRRDHGIGTVADKIEVVIVKLTAENGQTGYGEASPWSVFTGTPEGNFAALDRYLKPLVIGAKLADLCNIMKKAQRQIVHCSEAKAALETALYDLAGRILEKPVWALLAEKGDNKIRSKYRSEIPLSVSLANPEFDEDLKLVERLQADRVNIVKIKTGFKGHDFDQMRVEKLRQLYPDLDIRIDYNQGLDSADAMVCVMGLDQFNPTFIEQPVVAHDFDTMAALKKATKSKLLADESVFGPEDLKRAIAEEICDGVSVKIMKSGGMSRGMQVSQIAQEHDLPAYGGDMFETGIAHLAGVHMIAVCPNISLGCEFYHATYYLVEDLLADPFPILKGKVQIPNGPGLGIDVNPDMLEKYSITHVRHTESRGACQ